MLKSITRGGRRARRGLREFNHTVARITSDRARGQHAQAADAPGGRRKKISRGRAIAWNCGPSLGRSGPPDAF
jgi:hypothetical protein